MAELDDIDDELAAVEDELDDVRQKIFILRSRTPGFRAQLATATSPKEKARLEHLISENEREIDRLQRLEPFIEAQADELGREFRHEQAFKLKKKKPKL
jgi:predicted  nucleic acid-binding Zn-ribbon protein